jgi:signal transduction histidine kinase/ActR/RegA family two-component response regulator
MPSRDASPPPTAPQPDAAGAAVRRRVTWRYGIALALVAGAILAGWASLRLTIAATASDAEIINVAGAQRMLSQRIALLSGQLAEDPGDAAARRGVEEGLARMKAGFAALTEGAETPARGEPAIAAHYFERPVRLAARVEAFLGAAAALLGDPASLDARRAMAAARAEALGPQLVDLDRAVALLQAAANRRVAQAERLHAVVVLAALCVLALEAALIFRPLSRELGAATARLAARNARQRDALDEARRAEEARARFTAAVSHEMRTPLNGLIGMLDLMGHDPLDPAQAERLRVARAASGHAVAVLDDILDAASLEVGAFELTPRRATLRPIFEEALAVFAGRAAEKGLAAALDVDPSTPEAAVLDVKRVRQIVMNLVGNAVKFTPAGMVSLHVAAPSPGRLRVEVVDTSPGLSPEDRARLFGRFVRLGDSGSKAAGGAGLGLSICRDLVRAMGGEIGVEGVERQGATFWFEIPAPAADAQVAHAPATTEVAPGAGLRVLVVDDNEVNRLIARQMLERLGCRVSVAHDGVEAVDRVADQPFDLVFMDGEMPRMGGLEATRAIVTDWPGQIGAVVGLTAHAGAAERAACLAAGMADVIVKPARLEDFARAVARAADMAGAGR